VVSNDGVLVMGGKGGLDSSNLNDVWVGSPVIIPGYASSEGSTLSICPAGTYCINGILATCPAGTYSASSGAGSCTPCPPDSFSTGGAFTCLTLCPAGSFCDDGILTICAAGTYSAAGARECTPCPSGTTSATGATTCSRGDVAVWTTYEDAPWAGKIAFLSVFHAVSQHSTGLTFGPLFLSMMVQQGMDTRQ
jgi:hypothetical protein